ncbi:Nucleotidylyl transferase [Nemania sp. NC0429]|nr:Nucleotidylyl transferase [Nemania sp. NC0429]
MARLPSNLAALFTQALKTFESSDSTFRVLCSLPSTAPLSSSTPSPTTTPVLVPAESPPRPPRYIFVLDSSFNPPTLAHRRMVLSALSDPRYSTPVSHITDNHEGQGAPATPSASSSRVLLLLAINNADKAPKPASFPQRLAMMYAFAQDILASSPAKQVGGTQTQSDVSCEAVDIAVTTEPYFHAKARAIAASAFYRGVEGTDTTGSAAAEQVYLTGYDTLIRIFNPKYYPGDSMRTALDPFFAHAGLRVTMRTDDDWGDEAAQVAYLEELGAGGLEAVGGRVEWADKIELVHGRRGDEAVVSSTKVRDAVRREDWEGLGELVGEGVISFIRENELYTNDDR